MTATQSLTNEDLALLQKSHKRSYQEFSDSRKPLPPPPVSKNTSDIITQQSKKPATVMASQPTKATTNTSKPATVTSSQPIARPPTTQPVRAIPPSNNREIASNHPPATANKVQVSLVRRNMVRKHLYYDLSYLISLLSLRRHQSHHKRVLLRYLIVF